MERKVFITGATGHCGQETVKALCQHHPDLKIVACVRDLKKAKEMFCNMTKNIEFCMIENPVGNNMMMDEMVRNMRGCCGALIVPPSEHRVEMGKAYVDACRMAGIPFICLISVASIGKKNTLFARQFGEIENHIKQTQIRHCFLRCEFFMDNLLADAQSIKRDKTFSYPVNPDVRYAPVALCDIGAMAACLLYRNKDMSMNMGMEKSAVTTEPTKTTTTTTTILSVGEDLKAQSVSQTSAKTTTMNLPPTSTSSTGMQSQGGMGMQGQGGMGMQGQGGMGMQGQGGMGMQGQGGMGMGQGGMGMGQGGMGMGQGGMGMQGQSTMPMHGQSGMGMGQGGMGMQHSTAFHLTTSKAFSMTELAGHYSKLTKMDIKFVQVSRQEAGQFMMKSGVPQWQCDGILELWDMVNEGMCQQPCNDIELVLGRKATTLEEFLNKNSQLYICH